MSFFLGDSDGSSGSEGEGAAKTHSSRVPGHGSRKGDDDKLRVNEKFAKE